MIYGNLQNIEENTAFFSFMVSMICAWSGLIFTKNGWITKIEKVGNVLGTISLGYLLLNRWLTEGYFPISNLYESMIFLAWCLSFANLILQLKFTSRLSSSILIPIITSIIAFVSLILPEDMQRPTALIPALKSNWLLMHVSVMMTSYATLLVGCLFAIIFLIMSNGIDIEIKGNSLNNAKENTISPSQLTGALNEKQNNNKLINLLESFDNISYRFIGLGFPFLTLGIISGSVWANQAWGSYWSWDPKETWSLIAWLIFAVYLHTRITKSWQGKKPAYIASLGFVTVWICYLGVNFLGKGLHSYGWVL